METESRPTLAVRKPDAFEMKVRLACGALLGLVVGMGMCVSLWSLSTLGACMLTGFAMAACAACAARFGDSFWSHLR
jgi:hypothetical protein